MSNNNLITTVNLHHISQIGVIDYLKGVINLVQYENHSRLDATSTISVAFIQDPNVRTFPILTCVDEGGRVVDYNQKQLANPECKMFSWPSSESETYKQLVLKNLLGKADIIIAEPYLEEITIENCDVEFLRFDNCDELKKLSIINCPKLRGVSLNDSSIEHFQLKKTSVEFLLLSRATSGDVIIEIETIEDKPLRTLILDKINPVFVRSDVMLANLDSLYIANSRVYSVFSEMVNFIENLPERNTYGELILKGRRFIANCGEVPEEVTKKLESKKWVDRIGTEMRVRPTRPVAMLLKTDELITREAEGAIKGCKTEEFLKI